MLSGDQPTEPSAGFETDGGDEAGGTATAERRGREAGQAIRRDSAGDESANRGPEAADSSAADPAVDRPVSDRPRAGDRAEPALRGTQAEGDPASARSRIASPAATPVATRSTSSSEPVAPTGDEPARVAAGEPPPRQLSPRARLARLAGAVETPEPDRTATDVASGRPVDAPATTAMVRPRRAHDRADGHEVGGSESGRSASGAAAADVAETGDRPAIEPGASVPAPAPARRDRLDSRPRRAVVGSANSSASPVGGLPGAAATTRHADGDVRAATPTPRRGATAGEEMGGDAAAYAAARGGGEPAAKAGDAGTVGAVAARSAGGAGLPPELSPRAELDGGRPRRRRGLVHALVVGLSAIVSCAVFLVVLVGYGATRYFDGRLMRTDLSADRVEGTRPPAVPHGRETWLLVGSDVRTGADEDEVGGSRSDTMMIAYLGSNGSTTLVSVPRDLKVTIPAFTDSASKHHSAHTDKINSAFNLGGPALLVRTLENVSNVRIDHFAEIDFGGFKQMSDVLGGVQVCMVSDPYREYVAEDGKTSTNLNDPMSGFRGQVGENLLEGDNALAFVRQRHGFANGDYSRIERQQAFLAAVFRKVNSGDLLTDPAKLTGFLNAVTSAVTVDSGTRLTDLKTLALRTHAMSAGQVHFTTIPLSGAVSSPVYYALYDPGTVRSFFRKIIAGDDASAAAAPTPSAAPTPAVDPSQIRVTVLNGSPSGGAATRVAAKLRAAGYQVVRVGTNGSRAVTRTEVRYPAALSAAASRLIADVPGASAVPVDSTASPSTGATTTPAAGSSAAAGGMITLVVGEDIANGDTSVVATPTAGAATPAPYYTQAPVSANAGCVK